MSPRPLSPRHPSSLHRLGLLPWLTLVAALAAPACAGDTETKTIVLPQPQVIVVEKEVPVTVDTADAGGDPTGGDNPLGGGDAGPTGGADDPGDAASGADDATGADDAGPADDVPTFDLPDGPGGLTDGSGLIVHPDHLSGIFWYGLGVEPQTALASVGNTAVGIIVIPAVVQLVADADADADAATTGQLHIRYFDLDTFQPFDGEDGLVEAYPYEVVGAEGELRIEFEQPLTSLEIQLFGNCVYALEDYSLFDEPVFDAGLVTWPSVEYYSSQSCGGQGLPDSLGVNVHFLRRWDTNPDFEPREVSDDVPFGFFQTADSGDNRITRLPYIGAGHDDGQLTYYVTEDFPEHLRSAVDDVFEGWNDTLEDAAGNRPFLVEDAPPNMVPWDPRHRVVFWDDSQSQGAIAPFIEDPITGEMFDTDVIVWLADLSSLVDQYQTFFEDHPEVLDWVFSDEPPESAARFLPAHLQHFHETVPEPWFAVLLDDDSDVGLPARVLRRRAHPHKRSLHPAQLIGLFKEHGMTLTPEEAQHVIVRDFIVHEVGHNLGLRHNFEGSTDRERFGATSEAVATSTTTMDYVVGMTEPGTYDADAMRWAYGDGPEETGYFYCTDEHVEIAAGCARWDFGHPVLHFIKVIEGIVQEYPPGTGSNQLQQVAAQQEWNSLFTRVRQFVNTVHEGFEPEVPVSTFDFLLDKVLCEPVADEAPGSCATHIWFRNQFALYLLYTRHSVGGEWYDFPVLDDTQRETLFGSYFTLLLDPEQPAELHQTIVEKLPTSAVEGALDFLAELDEHLQGLQEPTDHEQWLTALVDSVQ